MSGACAPRPFPGACLFLQFYFETIFPRVPKPGAGLQLRRSPLARLPGPARMPFSWRRT